MRVMKFGGATFATHEDVATVLREITAAARRETVVAVVSAVGTTTDRLHDTAIDDRDRVDAVLREHHAVLDFLPEAHRHAWHARIARAVTDPVARDDAWLATGEVLASGLISGILDAFGVDVVDVGLEGVRVAADGSVDALATCTRLRHLGLDATDVLVLGGFAGRTDAGTVRVLGRGGSDYVATAVAAAIDADVVDLWKDVDGIHDRDPNRYAGTHRHDRLTWSQADAIARSDAAILHPRTIEPLRDTSVALRVRGIRTPWDTGTLVDARAAVPLRGRVS